MEYMSQKQSKNSEEQEQAEQAPFFVVSLPRSGTGWVANLLTWGDSFCFHEALFGCESLDAYEKTLTSVDRNHVGNADTGAIYLLPAIYKRWPQAKYIFIVRDLGEIEESLLRINLRTESIEQMSDYLWWGLSYVQGALIVKFEDLFTQPTMRKIWKHVGIEGEFPWQRGELLRNMHVEDGISTGFGRFTDKALVRENMIKFQSLMRSVRGDLGEDNERRIV